MLLNTRASWPVWSCEAMTSFSCRRSPSAILRDASVTAVSGPVMPRVMAEPTMNRPMIDARVPTTIVTWVQKTVLVSRWARCLSNSFSASCISLIRSRTVSMRSLPSFDVTIFIASLSPFASGASAA